MQRVPFCVLLRCSGSASIPYAFEWALLRHVVAAGVRGSNSAPVEGKYVRARCSAPTQYAPMSVAFSCYVHDKRVQLHKPPSCT
eukprot:11175809-Lingulodinium_polyedra.AAC.1